MRHRADPNEAEPPARRRLRLGVGAAIVLLLAVFVVAVLASAFAQRGSEVPVASTRSPSTTSASPSSAGGEAPAAEVGGELFVHVSGAVVSPGLVTLASGSRVVDAIAAAGGLTAEADPGGVNLARPLNDGEQLIVPKQGEAVVPAPGSAVGGGASAVVDLNAADLAQLETLPRIGPALAQRILDWREANGRFTQVTDLRKVAGIGDKVFDALKDRVRV